jgi:hypothetical protein
MDYRLERGSFAAVLANRLSPVEKSFRLAIGADKSDKARYRPPHRCDRPA